MRSLTEVTLKHYPLPLFAGSAVGRILFVPSSEKRPRRHNGHDDAPMHSLASVTIDQIHGVREARNVRVGTERVRLQRMSSTRQSEPCLHGVSALAVLGPSFTAGLAGLRAKQFPAPLTGLLDALALALEQGAQADQKEAP